MPVHSAGVLPYLRDPLRVFVGHMGGPFWARKDEAAWSLLKGEFDPASEEPEHAARREFAEESGLALDLPLAPLGVFRMSSGKRLHVFTCEADAEWELLASNTVELEWPPRSGRVQSFPEIDRAAWLDVDDARRRLVVGQRAVLDALLAHLGAAPAARLTRDDGATTTLPAPTVIAPTT